MGNPKPKRTMAPGSRDYIITTKSELPNEIILCHIAPRLAVESVVRLMMVSKEFQSFLKTPNFAKIHRQHETNDHLEIDDKVLVISTTKPLFSIIDRRRWFNYKPRDDDLTSFNRPVPFLHGRSPTNMKILASFHGLVCVGMRSEWRYIDLIVWNPVTGDYKILSEPDFYIEARNSKFLLIYSYSDDDYKLVLTFSGKVYMYSLKFDSWRKMLDSKNKLKRDMKKLKDVVWLNGNLYFLSSYLYLMRLDTKTEELTRITTPPIPQLNRSLIVHEGCIYMCATSIGSISEYETWIMNGDGNWSRVDTYNVPELHRKVDWQISSKKKNMSLTISGSMVVQGYTATLVSPNQYTNQ